jgi:ribose transport system permease protein
MATPYRMGQVLHLVIETAALPKQVISMASAEQTKQQVLKGRISRAGILSFLSAQGILAFFPLSMFVFSLFSEQFLSRSNIMTVVRQASIIGIIAVGVTVVIIGGNLDLSVGSMLSFATVLVVDLHEKIVR